jgi:translation initiation factor 1
MARKDRIQVTVENPFELNNPFAGLQIDNLPLGDSEPAPPSTSLAEAKAKAARGRVVLRRETAHRGGKIVIVIHDFAPFISTQSIEDLGRKLRSACGCGGTTRQRTIEIQGNQVDRIRSLLEQEGFRVAGVKA